MVGVCKALSALGVASVALLVLGVPAEAGQPWSCVCNGKPKRFIGSTNICGKDLYRSTHTVILEGVKLKIPRCSRAQFVAWNARACREEGCKLPKY